MTLHRNYYKYRVKVAGKEKPLYYTNTEELCEEHNLLQWQVYNLCKKMYTGRRHDRWADITIDRIKIPVDKDPYEEEGY